MNNAVLINEHFATAMGAARNAMQDLRYSADYAHVFRVCILEYNADKVPSTGKAIFKAFTEAFNGGQKMPILKTPLDCSCFLGVRGNDVYRALHDYDHFCAMRDGIGGTTRLQDEVMLNQVMVERIVNASGLTRVGFYSNVWAVLKACLLADLVGQSYYYAQKKDFVGNERQLGFVKWTAEKILPQVIETGSADFNAVTFPDFS